MPFPTDIASSLYLWIDRTLYIGAVFELESFMPAASSLMFGLEKPFRIRDAASADFVETRSVLIPAGVPVEAQPNNQLIAWCYLDP
ncbi:MAG TPA: hypothetical protein VM553_19875, partial [Dongiaceae bacterium]|nr:hypothetical protein [Dongiaceae bacterium]